jgi:hypothetical protein
MLSVLLQGRFGNHLWQYAVCRSVAEHLGYAFHIPRDFLGQPYFNCDLGEPTEQIYRNFSEIDANGGDINRQKYSPELFKIADGTRLVGFFQTEQYLLNSRGKIKTWFNVPDNVPLLEASGVDDNTCVIHFRGGDYVGKGLFLPKKFFEDAAAYVTSLLPNVKFVVVTDDVPLAKAWFPTYTVLSLDAFSSFTVVNKARYLIVSNSTFSWWAAWLSDNAKVVVAPKYWFGHNSNEGWLPLDSQTEGFTYLES